ncbi:flagellar hook-associated protein FlgK, partial [Aduncisulcus paluster]
MSTLTSEINRIHRTGYDLHGETNIDFFTMNGMSTEEFSEYLLTRGLDGGSPMDVTDEILSGVTDDMDHGDATDKIRENSKTFFENNPQLEGKNIRLVNDRYYVVDVIPADELSISEDLEDVNKIAASTTVEGLPGDGGNILNIANVRHDTALYDWGSPDDFVKSLVSNLGVDGQATKSIMDNQELLVKN